MKKFKRILSFALSALMIISMLTMCITVTAAEAESGSTAPTFKVWRLDSSFSIGADGSTATISKNNFSLESMDGSLKSTVTIVSGVESLVTVNDNRAFSKSETGIIDATPANGTTTKISFKVPETGTYYYDFEAVLTSTDTAAIRLYTQIGRYPYKNLATDPTGGYASAAIGNGGSYTKTGLSNATGFTANAGDWLVLTVQAHTSDGNATDETQLTINKFNVYKISDSSYAEMLPDDVTVKEYIPLESTKMWLVLLNKSTKLSNNYFKIDVDGAGPIAPADTFWSDRYNAYCCLVISETEPIIEDMEFSIADGSAESINYGMDLNGNGAVEVNDAQFVWNMYNFYYDDFNDATVEQFLSADVAGGANGASDYTVNVSDATAIMNACYSPTPTAPQVVPMWTEYSYDRTATGTVAGTENKSVIYLAKNETEGVNITLLSDTNRDSLKIVVLSGENEYIEHKMFFARPVNIDGTEYVDALIPLDVYGDLTLAAGKTTTVFADFKTSASTPAGDYPYEIALVDKDGNVLSTVRVTLHVWDFAMPEGRTFESSASIYSYGLTSPVDRYEFLLDYGLSPRQLPYDILDERADAYMSDPRVTSFVVPYDVSDEKLKQYCEKLATNSDWVKKAFFYPVDEPKNIDGLNALAAACERINAICAEVGVTIRITAPYYSNVWYSYEYSGSMWNHTITSVVDQVEFMDRYINLHCPKLANWNDSYLNSESGYGWWQKTPAEVYGSFADRMKNLDPNEKLWAYVCNEPNTNGYLNLTVDDVGLGHRVLFWQLYQRDVEGFLYWSVNYWVYDDRWDNLDNHDGGWYGDGILTYPGEDYGLYGQLLPSLRLVAVRDGIEDIELLYLAKEVFKNDQQKLTWLNGITDGVSSSLTNVNVDSDKFAENRIAIASAIEEALKNQ